MTDKPQSEALAALGDMTIARDLLLLTVRKTRKALREKAALLRQIGRRSEAVACEFEDVEHARFEERLLDFMVTHGETPGGARIPAVLHDPKIVLALLVNGETPEEAVASRDAGPRTVRH